MPSDSEPRTEAGRALLGAIQSGVAMLFAHDDGPDDPSPIPGAILAIETEAARLALEDVAERVRGLPVNHDITWADDQPIEAFVNRAAVLALFSTKEDGS